MPVNPRNLPRINFGSGNGRQSTAPNYSGGTGVFVPQMPATTAGALPASNPNPYQQPTWQPASIDANGNVIWNPANWGGSMNFGSPTTGTPNYGTPNTGTATPAYNWSNWQSGMGTDQNSHGYGGMNRQLTPYEDASGQRRASGWHAHRVRRGKGYLGEEVGSGPMMLPSRNYWDLRNNYGLGNGGGTSTGSSSSGYGSGEQWSNGLVNWSI